MSWSFSFSSIFHDISWKFGLLFEQWKAALAKWIKYILLLCFLSSGGQGLRKGCIYCSFLFSDSIAVLGSTYSTYRMECLLGCLRRDGQRLKGQCHEISDHFLRLIDSTWAPYEQAKTVLWTFSFSRRYSRKTCVCDYADTQEIILLWKK